MKLNVAAIGYGYWGKNIIRNFYELGVLRMVCDSDPEKKVLVEENYPDTQFTTDFDDILQRSDIDAVAVSTPALYHYQMVKHALMSGKDVFVEKPLALTVDEGEELVQLAAEHKRILMVGHILRYHPAVIKLKELIDVGGIGQIRYVYSNRLNIGKIRAEENILWSFAPHDISVILSLLDEEPISVSCHGSAYVTHTVEDVTNTYLKFPSGVNAHIFVSWLHPFKEQRLVVVGSEKMAVFDDTCSEKLVIYPHRVEWKQRIPTAVKAEKEVINIDNGEPLKSELQHFLECVDTRSLPQTDGAEGVRVLRVLSKCEQFLRVTNDNVNDSSTQFGVISNHINGVTSAKSAIRSAANSEGRVPQCTPKTGHQSSFVHRSAYIDEPCQIGDDTKIWHFSHVLKDARIGKKCIIGQNCCISEKVVIGNNVKIQNNVSVYTGAIIEDDVFLGPSCVLTNVTNPRSQVNRHVLYETTLIRKGATIGANATIICGIEIGRYAFIGAGTVVTKDVPDYALVVGNPAKQVGWVSRLGHRLHSAQENGIMRCPESGYRYQENEAGVLECLDLGEDQDLPESQSVGKKSYDNFKISDGSTARSLIA